MKSQVMLEGLDEGQAKELSKITNRLIASYYEKSEITSDEEWLKHAYKTELPEISDLEAEQLSRETLHAINEYDTNLQSLHETLENGGTREGWFSKKVQEASVGLSVNDLAMYLQSIDRSIQQSNVQMQRVVTNLDGSISQSLNLDGFMAEQYHVNSFNMNAALSKSPYRAEVLAPKTGETYGKNSFDVVIRDQNNKIVHQYQMKYGKTASDTIDLINKGNYNNQRIIVPAEQLDEVRKAFPNKSIESSIGGTDVVQTKSNPLEKWQAKEMQRQAQLDGIIKKETWNHYDIRDLSVNIARGAGVAGVQAAVITTGFDLARRAVTGEKFNAQDSIELALKTGADAGIKAATTGAVKVAVERGIITVIPKGTPAGVIANIVCVGIENVKILGKIAKGELSISQGLDHMGRTTTSMVYGIGWGTYGSLIGAAALSWIPVVGPFIGGLAGGMVGYMAGSKSGEAVYETGKKIVNTAKKVASTAWEGIKSVGRSISNFIFG